MGGVKPTSKNTLIDNNKKNKNGCRNNNLRSSRINRMGGSNVENDGRMKQSQRIRYQYILIGMIAGIAFSILVLSLIFNF